MTDIDESKELPVTFHPGLFLQRRGWILDIMRREGVTEVLDVGCGEGELLSCLCNPAPWLASPPLDILPTSDDPETNSIEAALLADLHRDILHPTKIAGSDISKADLECTRRITEPQQTSNEPGRSWHSAPARWEPLEVNVWEGGLEHYNPAFVGVECIVAMEVIEHLPEPVLARFAPVLLGAYHPRLLLVTTPSYTFNARFTAPDAPPAARSGWRDPTGRTSRVFRHHDHKFEWTVDEFASWAAAVAEEWGYEILDIGGVGKAAEEDAWGRDEELGWASQVVAFKRREGREWAGIRERRWAHAEAKAKGDGVLQGAQTEHQLLATHHHRANDVARRPLPLEAVGELVVEKMVGYRETSIALEEIWFESEVERACGGWIDWLVRAVQTHNRLAIAKADLFGGAGVSEVWVIRLDPSLHALGPPDSRPGSAWASPPDTDEVYDPGNTLKDDFPSGEDDALVVKDEGDHVDGLDSCDSAIVREDWSWGESDITIWGTSEGALEEKACSFRGWGAPDKSGGWT